ncbi:hypothetical protein G6F31_016536 [Rhizopus arrhizus]|nr:hypothetical protein G6F31_016536 [Rhizopus arrhizus]
MPAHEHILNPEQIKVLTAWVWGLSNNKPAAAEKGAAAPAAPLAATAANSKWKMGQPQASARRLAETRRPGNRIRGRRVPARKRWSRPWRVCAARAIREPLVAASPAGVSPSSLSPS